MILMYYNLVSVSFHNPEIHVCLRPGLDIRFSLDMLLHISRNAYRISHLVMQLLDRTGRTGLYSSIETVLHYNLTLFRNCYWHAWSCYILGTTALFLLLSFYAFWVFPFFSISFFSIFFFFDTHTCYLFIMGYILFIYHWFLMTM